MKGKYCWTHGGCNNDLVECSRKSNGHKDTATFAAKHEGSKSFCPAGWRWDTGLVNNDKVKKALKCYQSIINSSPVVSHTNKQACTLSAKGDSATIQRYWREEDSKCLNAIIEKYGPFSFTPKILNLLNQQAKVSCHYQIDCRIMQKQQWYSHTLRAHWWYQSVSYVTMITTLK